MAECKSYLNTAQVDNASSHQLGPTSWPSDDMTMRTKLRVHERYAVHGLRSSSHGIEEGRSSPLAAKACSVACKQLVVSMKLSDQGTNKRITNREVWGRCG